MSAAPDKRLVAARPDLAAASLRGAVEAERYVDPQAYEVVHATAPLRRHPQPDAPLDTEALHGERVDVYETTDEGWAWGQLQGDRYVGWLPMEALRRPGPSAATHRVAALRTFVYPGPSIKLQPTLVLSLGAQVRVARVEKDFAVIEGGGPMVGYLFAGHLAPVDAREPDFVAVAERFVHVPYLWGGKTSLGLDCSGLVQLACAAAGLAAPRDSDMQEKSLGQPLPLDLYALQRGDLVFWKGHVGVMRDATTLLHANGFYMMVVSEPLAVACARIDAKSYGVVTSVRRLG